MAFPPLTSAPERVLHVDLDLGCTGTLAYDFGHELVCMVELRPALTSLMLALAACRAIDERRKKKLVNVGARSLAELGRYVRVMPGPGNAISQATVGEYKREICKRVEGALATLSRESGRPLGPLLPIEHEGWGKGYRLPKGELQLIGVSLEDLVRAVLEERARWPPGVSPDILPR